jgi:hypothetical protein
VNHAVLFMQILDVAHWASLPAKKQSELHGRRALVSRAANQPVHAFADWLHATQVLLLLYHAVYEDHPAIVAGQQGVAELICIAVCLNVCI